MKAFDFYKTCRWQCPACKSKQNGIIKKLATQYYLKCCVKYCEHIVSNPAEIADLANLTIGDIKPLEK